MILQLRISVQITHAGTTVCVPTLTPLSSVIARQPTLLEIPAISVSCFALLLQRG